MRDTHHARSVRPDSLKKSMSLALETSCVVASEASNVVERGCHACTFTCICGSRATPLDELLQPSEESTA